MLTKNLLKKSVMLSIISAGVFFTSLNEVYAMETVNRVWVARTIEQVKADLKISEGGISSYTVKWGDTLSVISKATNISIEQLAKVNNIENIRLIEVDTVFYFNEDKSVLTIEDGNTITSFSVETAKKVETPKAFQEVLKESTVSITQDTISEQNEKEINETEVEKEIEQPSNTTQAVYSLSQFMFQGVINWSGYKFTYYSQSVLPGGGLSIPGRHVNENGYVVDGEGYIVLANNAPIGTVIDTPFGAKGKVYDRGTVGNHFDVYIR